MSDHQGREYRNAGLTGRLTQADYSGTTAAVHKAFKDMKAREHRAKIESRPPHKGRRHSVGGRKTSKKTAGRRRRGSRRTMSRR